jgi:hypothetical protein
LASQLPPAIEVVRIFTVVPMKSRQAALAYLHPQLGSDRPDAACCKGSLAHVLTLA